MKKIIITALLLISSSMYADMFDSNTDIKSKYEFDIDVANENQKLSKKLETFQNGEATEEDIKVYLDAMANSTKKPFADDVKVDSIFIRVDENSTNEDSGWFSWFSWFDDEEEVIAEEVAPADNEEIQGEEAEDSSPIENDEVQVEEKSAEQEKTAPVKEINPQEGAQ